VIFSDDFCSFYREVSIAQYFASLFVQYAPQQRETSAPTEVMAAAALA
jgi:hypothetical protein